MSQQVKHLPDENTIHGRIDRKLRGLGVNNFRILDPEVGPVVTSYPILLHYSTSIKSILNKADDIALACGVENVNIHRENNRVIVEVPNEHRETIDFKDALFWALRNEEVKNMKLPILLGQNPHGEKAAIDLVSQPHILIAGSTGSGKSVLESGIIATLAMLKDPSELKLYIVDPKRVDLTLFHSLPHVAKVVKEINEWYPMINALYEDVQNRNKFLERAGARNIDEYNQGRTKGRMAYKVLIIDELADLIEKDKYQREENKMNEEENDLKAIDAIKRLIQVSRAAGIHIIACTQRTSVDVVTGVVKANFGTRISLRLPSQVDSRTILDQKGAENLLGKGDMLIKHADSDTLERYHAPFISMKDIEFILAQKEQIQEQLGVM